MNFALNGMGNMIPFNEEKEVIKNKENVNNCNNCLCVKKDNEERVNNISDSMIWKLIILVILISNFVIMTKVFSNQTK